MKKIIFIAISIALITSSPVLCAPIAWTDWISATTGADGSAKGVISLDGSDIGVSYTGDVDFAQLGTGTNYWTEGDPAPYTGNSVVDNAPTPSELIALSRSGIQNTISFSEALLNPVMAIASQGRTNLPVSYDFDQSFTVLSEGMGYWGDGHYELLPGDILKGYELHAVIQFNGLVDAISWTSAPGEYWHGITVGAASPVPEPGTFVLLFLGVAGLFGYRKFTK